MDTARKMELKAGLAQCEKAIEGLEEQIDAFNRHIDLLNQYLSGERGPYGSRKNPFDEVSLLKELAKTQKYIGDMKGLQMKERQKMDELQKHMNHAEFVSGEQRMVVELQPVKRVVPVPGV